MIEEILPASVRSAEMYGDVGQNLFFDAERAMVVNAVADRQAEFSTVRHCARTALRSLGIAPAPLLPDEFRAPTWPEGIVGSMTHTAGYRGAAVARSSDVLTIGIDAEPDEPLPNNVLHVIAPPGELDGLRRLSKDSAVAWDRLLFSAKESIYKAWFPLTRRSLGFEETVVRLHADGTFEASLYVDMPLEIGKTLAAFDGRWISRAGTIVTAIVISIE